MPNRILKESICTSDTIDRLSWFEEVFFYRLLVNCDDYGRMDARPAILRSRLFPLKTITDKQVEGALNALRTAGIVEVYIHDNRPYLQLRTWDKHQQIRARRAKYPNPPAEVQGPREHDLPLENDVEKLLYEHLSSTMAFNNDELVSVDRQVRVKECYLDIVAKTHDSAYIFEIKRNRLSNKAIEQITNYLELMNGRGILIGCGLAANFDITACSEREIAVVSYDDDTLEISAIYKPTWLNKCDLTLNHVNQRLTMLAPNPNPIQYNPNPNTNPSICAEQAPAPAVITLTLNDKSEYPISQEQVDGWKELYPAVDVMQQLRGMKGWLDANPARRKTKTGILRFVNSWLSREQDKGRASPRKSADGMGCYERPTGNYDHLAVNFFADDFGKIEGDGT